MLNLETSTVLASYSFFSKQGSAFDWALESDGVFAPDGSSFLATAQRSGCCDSWGFEISHKASPSIGKALKTALGMHYAFLGPDQIVVADRRDPKGSGVYSWPDGKLIERFTIPDSPLSAVTRGAVVLIRPMGEYAVGALSVPDKRIFQVSSRAALDRFDDFEAAERSTGGIGLYSGRKTQPIATLELPEADLGNLRSAVHSPDLQWIALSASSRSILWKLDQAQGVPLAPFSGGYISPEGVWTALFDETEGGAAEALRSRELVSVDLPRQMRLSAEKVRAQPGQAISLVGRYEISITYDAVSVRDRITGAPGWSRHLPSPSALHIGNVVALRLPIQDPVAAAIIRKSPELSEWLEPLSNRIGASLLEVLELATGKSLGHALLEDHGRPFTVREVLLAGSTLFVRDNTDRTLAYALGKDDRTGIQVGRVMAADPVRSLVAVQDPQGHITVLDPSMRQIAGFDYPRNVIYAGFDRDGKRLLMVTSAQEAFIENLP